MSHLSDLRPAVSPLLITALLLAARGMLSHLRLPHPTARQIFEATSASRSRAYELTDLILSVLPTLGSPVGRPRCEARPRENTVANRITGQVLSFVMQHPGCVHRNARRQRYSEDFRSFILELCEQQGEVSLEALAEASQVPWGTLKDWLRGGQMDITAPAIRDTSIRDTAARDTAARDTAARTDPITTRRIETVIAAWRLWKGSFCAFCDHVRINLRVPFGRTLIQSILEQHGERSPRRRSGRSPDEKALRGAFETFFPGAQWVGDGTPIVVQIGEQGFRFNLELMVDAKSSAAVGVSTRDEEDGKAVTEAFEDGVKTSKAPPLCTLLDNRPSNHTAEVDEGLGSSMRMHSTLGRAQNKAHVEGAFGLFAQVVPLLAITAISPKEMARQVLQLVVQTWARTLNHKLQKKRKGRSRVEIYTSETPTPEQVEQARVALKARCKKQQMARKTLHARQNPIVRDILDDAFARLHLDDPEGNLRSAIARYPLDAVVNGIATFEGKSDAGTLPDGVDGRYLLGIVKNISQKDEGPWITEALLRARLEAQDRLLTPLTQNLASLLQLSPDPIASLKVLARRALDADRQIDRLFWLRAIVDHIRQQHSSRHTALLRFVSRRIHAAFVVPHGDRQMAVRFLCAGVIHLA